MLACEATGTTGSAVLRELDRAGVRVRAKTRSPESAERLPRLGVEAVVSDLGDQQPCRRLSTASTRRISPTQHRLSFRSLRATPLLGLTNSRPRGFPTEQLEQHR